MNLKVYYELWEMECCGKPFKIGDSIGWLVSPAENINFSFKSDNIKYIYDAHNDDWTNIYYLTGIVKKIYIDYEKYELKTENNHRMLVPINGASKLVETNTSDVEEYKDEYHAGGYLVELDNVTVRPAKKH